MFHRYGGKIVEAYNEADPIESRKKWQEIFGEDFGGDLATANRDKAHIGRARDTEEFLERHRQIPIRLNRRYHFKLLAQPFVEAGPNPSGNPLRRRGNFVPIRHKIRFSFAQCDVPEPYKVFWKIRNYDEDAIKADQIRGQILEDEGKRERIESTLYRGNHYVECYIVKDGVCVAMDHQPVIVTR